MNTISRQWTLGKEVSRSGSGLHSGETTSVVLRPATAGSGIVFVQNGRQVPAQAGLVQAAPLCTLLEEGEHFHLSTVEHLMAALHALGVDNAEVEVDGPEVPILDGSALPWVEAIDEAGRRELDADRNWLKVEMVEEVHDGLKALRAEPCGLAGLFLRAAVNFPHPLVGSQTWEGEVDEDTFRHHIAPARTFVLEKDIAAAREAGLVKGGGLENALVFGADGTVKNEDGLRFIDEPVRHKVLDAVGDLFMAGRPVWGRFDLTMPGHGLNNRLLRKIAG